MRNLRPLEFTTIVLVYLGLAGLCATWDALSRSSALYAWEHSQAPSFAYLVLSFFLVFFYLAFAQLNSRFTTWARQLNSLLAHLLTPISYLQMIVIAVMSGFIEEWFFRGILLSHFGVTLSSVFFGLCHLILIGRIWVWSLWSAMAGFILALLVFYSKSLYLAAMAHFSINLVMLFLLNMKAYNRPSLMSTQGE